MSRPLTEKTLELNIMAELAHLGRLAGYNPYFIGFSQLDEMRHGGDTYYSAGSKIGFFQFKRGYHKSKFYTFYINNNSPHFNQHTILSSTDSLYSACRYVFSLAGTNEDVYTNRGHLLSLTAFLSPREFDISSQPNKPHRVRLYGDGSWEQYSDILKKGSWRNIYGNLPQNSEPFNDPTHDSHSNNLQPEAAFHRLELPKVGKIMDGIKEVNSSVELIFKQRSSFCMIFS